MVNDPLIPFASQKLNQAEGNEQSARCTLAPTKGSKMSNDKSVKSNDHIKTAFVMLPTQLLADVAAKRISEPAYVLYSFLKFWEGTNDHLWYGEAAMAEQTGFSKDKVKRLIRKLLKTGHIARSKRMGKSSLTKCRTYVDKTGTVFVAGGAVNRPRKDEKASTMRIEPPPTVAVELAKESSGKNGTEDSTEYELFADIEKPAAATKCNLPETEIAQESIPQEVTASDDSWKHEVPWDNRLQIMFEKYDAKYFPIKAKRLFLRDVAAESEELRELYEREFPNAADDEIDEPLF